MKTIIWLIIINLTGYSLLSGQTCKFSYNGEPPPGTTPITHGLGSIVDDTMKIVNYILSSGGDDLIIDVQDKGLYYMKRENDKWSVPEFLAFSKKFLTHFMYLKFSPDGQFLSFVDGNSKQYGYGDIFMVKRGKDNIWSDSIIKLPEPINSNYRDAGHCFTSDGKLYFTSGREDKKGNNDIFRAIPQENGVIKIEFLSEISKFCIITDEENLYVSPNEEYLITDSWHQYSKRKHDLFITYRIDNNKWSDIKPLNSKINTENFETSPFVTGDHNYLFFGRNENGVGKRYWVSTKEVFVPYQRLKIPDFYEKINKVIKIVFPQNTFDDFNGEIIDYEVCLRDTDKLPDWLNFDKTSLTLSGKTDKTETLTLLLKAKDNDDNKSETEFKIIIEE